MNLLEKVALIAVCIFYQLISFVEAVQYPSGALAVIIVSVLIPGFVIFAVIFTAVFFCCYWRKIPFLRRQFSASHKGHAKPKTVPFTSYPHQAQVQYTPASPGPPGYEPDTSGGSGVADSGGGVAGEGDVKIKLGTEEMAEEPIEKDIVSRYPE